MNIGRISASIIVLYIVLLSSAFSGVITVGISFDFNDLVFNQESGYDFVTLKDPAYVLTGEPGSPWIPALDVRVILPPSSLALSAKPVVDKESELAGAYLLHPAQYPKPVSEEFQVEFTPPEKDVYESPFTIPSEPAILLDTVSFRNYRIAIIRVYPLSYTPLERKLIFRSEITLNVSFETDESEVVYFPDVDGTFRNVISTNTLNAEMLDDYEPVISPLTSMGGTIQYLLITDESLLESFKPLTEWKTKKGVPAEAVSTQWIYENYSGTDQQEKIKACIRDYAVNRGTIWVALGGDDTIVPPRRCYAEVLMTTDATIPTDLYYAALDEMNWDDDGDDLTGEVGDDTIDMIADVYLGRIPVRTAGEASTSVSKIIAYEKNPPFPEFSEKMLLAGVKLWNDGDAEGKSESLYNNWIKPVWNPVRDYFYDTNTSFPGGADYNVTPVNMNALLSTGYNFLHMASHGSRVSWSMEAGGGYSSTVAINQSSPGIYTNILTIACHTGAFDTSTDPCLAEAFIRNPAGGAVSFIGPSRFGWDYPNLTGHGPSFQYNRLFYQLLFSGWPPTSPRRIGAVFNEMKSRLVGGCLTYGALRWLYFSINLLADPEMPLYTAKPSVFKPAYQKRIFAGCRNFSVETGIPDARVCIMKNSFEPGGTPEIYAWGNTDFGGRFEAHISPISAGIMHVTVTTPNYLPYEGNVEVLPISDGMVIIEDEVITAGSKLNITVADSDLVGAGHELVEIITSQGGDGETILLQETGTGTGIFTGTIDTAIGPFISGDDKLQIIGGETVTAVYMDANDGSSGTNVMKTDNVPVDESVPGTPAIYSIKPVSLGTALYWNAEPGVSYTVQWSTDLKVWKNVIVGRTHTWIDTTYTPVQKYYRILKW